MNPEAWWPFGAPSSAAGARLICFPFAGGGASVYRAWRRSSPPGMDICPVQLPGREGRIREAPFRRIEPLIDLLAESLPPGLFPPYAFFGHSMGALIAFELARRLVDRGHPPPAVIFPSAARPPHRMRRSHPLHALPDEAFRAALRDLEGTPDAVLEHEELMELLLPTLRADFELCETYEYRGPDPLACPVLAFGGSEDPNVSPEELRGWGEMTRGGFRDLILPGGHFFLETHSEEILRRVREAIPASGGPRSSPAC